MKEYLFLIVCFASTDIGFNLGLQLLYGETSILSFVVLAIGVIIVVICIIMFIFYSSEEYGELKTMTKLGFQ
jgi:hypothetical protein